MGETKNKKNLRSTRSSRKTTESVLISGWRSIHGSLLHFPPLKFCSYRIFHTSVFSASPPRNIANVSTSNVTVAAESQMLLIARRSSSPEASSAQFTPPDTTQLDSFVAWRCELGIRYGGTVQYITTLSGYIQNYSVFTTTVTTHRLEVEEFIISQHH